MKRAIRESPLLFGPSRTPVPTMDQKKLAVFVNFEKPKKSARNAMQKNSRRGRRPRRPAKTKKGFKCIKSRKITAFEQPLQGVLRAHHSVHRSARERLRRLFVANQASIASDFRLLP